MAWKRGICILGIALLCTSVVGAKPNPAAPSHKQSVAAMEQSVVAVDKAGALKLATMEKAEVGTTEAVHSAVRTAVQAPSAALTAEIGPAVEKIRRATSLVGLDEYAGRAGGEDCATATVIGSLPFTDTGDTTGAIDDYDEACPYTGSTSPDHVYSYTPAADETVNISLCNAGTTYDTKLYVYTSPDNCATTTLVACMDDSCPGYISDLQDVALTGGTTYFIVVDGYGGASGAYELTVAVAEECTPAAPNDNCADVTPVALSDGVPVTFTGDNTCATHECASFPSGEGHLWEAFTLTECMDVTLDYCGTSPAFGNAWLNLTDCPCTGFSDAGTYEFTSCGDGNVTIVWTALAAGTYYYPVMLDIGNGAVGPYTINVVGTACGVVVCGDGTCDAGEDCVSCEADCGPCGACADFTVTAPGTWAGSTCGAVDDCDVTGSDNEEHIYEVTLPSSGDWTFSLCGSGYDTKLQVGTSCCSEDVGYNDDSCGLQSEIIATLTAGTYYVTVDGFGTGCGDYTLAITGGGGPVCGDGTCDAGEDCASCSADCGPCVGDCTVIIEIMTDNYPSETTWDLVDSGGTVVASGGPFVDPLTLHTITVTDLDCNECYTFTIYDAFGDGICCTYGDGYYNVYWEGALAASGGEFGASESSDVGNCGGALCTIDIEIMTDNYPSETTWDLVDSGGVIVASGGPFVDPLTLHTVQVADLDCNECYTFTIYDAFGDGICCSYGDGYYNVYWEGTLAASGGTFGASESSDVGNCVGPSCPILIEIMTDDYPSETTWDLVDSGGTIVASGGPYVDPATLHTAEYAADCNECYTFTIYDAFGDGICCSYGAGYYTVYFDGTLYASGGEFGASESSLIGPNCVVATGACCVSQVCVATNTAAECGALGGSWTEGQDCATYVCPENPLDCPAGSLFGQVPHGPDDGWSFGTSSETTAFNYKIYENFSGVSGNICDIHWWGLSLVFNAGWSACDPTGMTFEVTFHADAGGAPGAVVCGPHVVAPTITATGILYASVYEMYKFDVLSLPSCCALSSGWVSIKGLPNANDCAFLWASSAIGDLDSLQEDIGAGTPPAPTGYDRGVCLTGEYVPTFGACCDDSTGVCEDGVEMLACSGRFAADTLCAVLDPQCGDLPGACCHPDGTCSITTETACADNWLGAYSDCADCPCVTIPPNDNCADVTPVALADGVPVTFNGDNTCATNECADFGGYDGHVWEAFTLTECMDVTLDYCGTGPPAFGNAWLNLTDCPCTGFTPGGTYDFTSCSDGNVTIRWAGLPAGTYYYPVMLAPEYDSEGPYTINVVGVSCPIGACCQADGTCAITTETDCTGTFLGDGSECLPNACDGACCAPDGSCTDTAEAACADSFQGSGTDCATTNCPIVPDNDNCSGAIDLGPLPATVSANTELATDDLMPTCGTSSPGHGVWYTVTGTGNTITATTCDAGTDFDTKIQVWCGDCAAGQTCVAGNDDASCTYSGLHSTVSWCSQLGGTYHLLVGGFSANVGNFTLSVTDDGASCTPDVACLPTGSCCHDGVCDTVAEAACAGLGGTYGGDGSVCGATGACCLADTCIIGTADCCAEAGGSYQGDGSSCESVGATTVYDSGAVALPIPDADPLGVSHTITVSDSFTLGDVNIDLIATHTWIGDLCVKVEHGGTEITVIQRIGDTTGLLCDAVGCCGCGDDNLDVILDDEGTGGAINDNCAPVPSPPSYTPEEALSAFDGMDSAGDWTITISDNAGLDTGTLESWSLHLSEPGDDPCGCGDLNGDGLVNEADYWLLVDALNSCVGDPRYYPPADLSGDDCVSLIDFGMWLTCYNEANGRAFVEPKTGPGPQDQPSPDPRLNRQGDLQIGSGAARQVQRGR